jgi:spore maturation protein CgeB
MQKSYRVILPTERVGPEEYYREISGSKICVSPFGYGEICWRDFEAILCGSLIIKPNMDHIETTPDIFKAHQTYVPVRWDYSDLEEKCSYYLAHDAERERIAKAAFDVLDSFYRGHGIIKILAKIFGVERGINDEP